MAGTATWTISGTSSDGSIVTVIVTATLFGDGGIKVEYALAEDSAPADLNGIFFDFFNDGGDITKFGSNSNNMKGYGDGFDYAEEIGLAGLGTDGEKTFGEVYFSAAQLADFGFTSSGEKLLEDFAETEIGFRITSTGEDREGSLKIGAVGEYHGDDDDDDFFPQWPQDISNAVFYIDTTGDGSWDKAVKIDDFPDDKQPTWISNDMDDLYACMFEFIQDYYADDDTDTSEWTLIGVSIKGGTQPDKFFLIEGDENGPEPDDGPTWNTGNQVPDGETVHELDYDDFHDFCIA